MSLQLVERLNGGSRGHFRRFLNGLSRNPQICWYPSAMHDFRDLLYLTPEYAAFQPPTGSEGAHPDLFIHTDYYPWDLSRFLDNRNLLPLDLRTTVFIREIEEICRLDLPRHPDLVHFPEQNVASGRVIYLRLSRRSHRLGDLPDAHLLYAFVENAAFCEQVLLPEQARISHLVHVRYGGGCGGGGTAGGAWLSGVLRRLGCGTVVSDGRLGCWQDGDRRAVRIFPGLADPDEGVDPDRFEQIRVIPGRFWSDHGDVRWLRTGIDQMGTRA